MPRPLSKKRRKVAPKIHLNQVKPFNEESNFCINQVLNAIPYCVATTDINGTYKVWNKGAEKLFGYKGKEVIDQIKASHLHKNSDVLTKIVEKVTKKGKFKGEVELKKKDGSFFIGSLSVKPLRDQHGNISGFMESIMDLSKEKKIAKEKAQLQEVTKQIFEHTGSATVIFEPDMRICYANSEFEKLSGYKKSKIIGKKTWMDFFSAKEIPMMMKYHQTRKKNKRKTPRNHEATFIDKDGQKKSVLLTVGTIPETNQTVASLLDVSKLKQAQNALRSSKKLFDDLVQSNPTPIYAVDTSGHVIYWNKAMQELSGIHSKEMIYTKNHWSLFYMQETKMIVDLLVEGKTPQQILKLKRYKSFRMSRTRLGSITGIKFYPNFNGQKKWFKFYIKPMKNGGDKIIGAIETISDITPEKITNNSLENRLRELEVLYKISHRQQVDTPTKIIINDIIKNLVKACDVVKPARARITIDGKSYTNLKKGEGFIKKIECDIEINQKNRGKVELGYIEVIPDKESFNLNHEKKVISIVAENISKFIQNRELLERHQKLVNKSMIGIFIVQNGKFRFANPKFLKILRAKKSEIIKQPASEWISKSDLQKSQHQYLPVQTKISRSDGKKIDVEIRGQSIEHYGQKALLGTMQDITKIKKAQERQQNFNLELKTKISEKTKDLRAANKRLQSLNQLKDEFIATASHELRSPLTSARGYLSFLTGPNPIQKSSPDYHKYIRKAYRNLEDLNYLINNILDVSNIERERIQLNLENTCLIKLCKKIIEQISMESEKKNIKINLKIKAGGRQLFAWIDTVRMSQVIRNILDNAIKYSKPNKNIEFLIAQEKDHIKIAIKDSGVGIKKTELNKIFDKFKRIDNPSLGYKSGSGLGLFIAHKILELHSGKINVKSKVNQGTTFTIQLPIHQP